MKLRSAAITMIAMTSLAIPAAASAMPPLSVPSVSAIDSGPPNSDHGGNERCLVKAQATVQSGSSAAADHTAPESGVGSATAADRYIEESQTLKREEAMSLVARTTGGPDSSSAADHTYWVSGAGSSAAAERHIEGCQGR